jgi:hypothetical protein
MNSNLDIKQISGVARSLLKKVRQYATFSFIVAVLLIYSFLILRINVLTQSEPSDEVVNEQLNTVKRLKIDQDSINKIEQLEDQNIDVQSLFNKARDNPFQD